MKKILLIIFLLLITIIAAKFVLMRADPRQTGLTNSPDDHKVRTGKERKQQNLVENRGADRQKKNFKSTTSGNTNRQYIDALEAACRNADKYLMRTTIKAIGQAIADDPDLLVELLENDISACTKAGIISSIDAASVDGPYNNQIISDLITFILDPAVDTELKYNAVRHLSNNNTQEVSDLLGDLILVKDTDEHLKVVATLSLGEMAKGGNENALNLLFTLLKNASLSIQYKSIQALSGILGKEVVTSLLSKYEADNNRDIRSRVLKSLGTIEDDNSVNALINIVTNETDNYLRVVAIRSLEQIGNKKAIPCLENILSDTDKELVQYAERAINTLKKQ